MRPIRHARRVRNARHSWKHFPIRLGGNFAADLAMALRGLNSWKRLPAYRVRTTADGHRVWIPDISFVRRVGSGLGATVVKLDRGFRVISRRLGRQRALMAVCDPPHLIGSSRNDGPTEHAWREGGLEVCSFNTRDFWRRPKPIPGKALRGESCASERRIVSL